MNFGLMRFVLIGLLAPALAGCHAGTWSEDPKNWERAFKEKSPPKGISIVHSWYMRTPHFTAEYAWFFEVKLSDKTKKDLIGSPDLVP